MSNIHVVIGTGTASAKTIASGLEDVLKKDDTVAVPWYGTKPVPKGLVAVYDYLLDEEIPTILVHANGTTPPKMFEADNVSYLPAANVNTKLLRALDGKGNVLVLWDKDEEDESIALAKRIFDVVDESTLVLELTNGLAPVSYADDEPAKADAEDPADDDDEKAPEVQPLTRVELESMPAAALKKMAKDTGNLPDGIIGKANYIKVILGEELPGHAYPPGREPEDAPKAETKTRRRKTEEDTEPAPGTPASPTVVGEEDLKRSLFPNPNPSDEQGLSIEQLRNAAFTFGKIILTVAPVGRNRALAITALEDAVTRTVRSICLDGES